MASSLNDLCERLKISNQDLRIYQKILLEYDANRDGCLTKIETRNCLERLCIRLDNERFKSLYEKYAHIDGLDLNGFLEFVSFARKGNSESEDKMNVLKMSSAFMDVILPASDHPGVLHSQFTATSSAKIEGKKANQVDVKIEVFVDYRMFDENEDLDKIDQSIDFRCQSPHIEEFPMPKRKPLAVAGTKSEKAVLDDSESNLSVSIEEIAHKEKDDPFEKDPNALVSPTSAPAARQQKKKKAEKGPTKRQMNALMNPSVRKQLLNQKPKKPIVMIVMAVVLIGMMIAELVVNGGIESFTLNPMGGPSVVTLVRLGGKYVPCMKRNETIVDTDFVTCYPGFKGLKNDSVCTYYSNTEYLCGMGGFKEVNKPDQWWRFITPIFLHVGLIHLVLNLSMLLKTGIALERVIGGVRMIILYVLSGIGGNLFSSIMAPRIVSVGASSSLYGFYGLLLLDLIQNWPLLSTPYRDLIFLVINIVISLGVGLLPFIDNYAHIGGFVTGLLSGIVFMPRIFYSKWDKRRKIMMAVVCLPLIVAAFVYGFIQFYTASGKQICDWCVYLDCVPPNSDWCKNERP